MRNVNKAVLLGKVLLMIQCPDSGVYLIVGTVENIKSRTHLYVEGPVTGDFVLTINFIPIGLIKENFRRPS